jgi:hypothetical protein
MTTPMMTYSRRHDAGPSIATYLHQWCRCVCYDGNDDMTT